MKRRIVGATLAIVVCALVISNVVGVLLFRSRELEAARRNLHELLILMDAQSAVTDPAGVAEQFLQAAPDKRLTIIGTDGAVLADTSGRELEGHGQRPEVELAAATGWGESIRRSDTLHTDMFYVAKRFADGMIGRASMSLSSINTLVWGGVWGFLPASAAALLLALLLSRRMAERAVEPLHAVSESLQRVLEGSSPAGLEAYRGDEEIRPIMRYIDKLVERLRGYIQSITEERDKVALILDCMDEGFLLLDGADQVLAMNRAAGTLLDLPREETALLLTRSRPLRDAIAAAREKRGAVVVDLDARERGRSLRVFVSHVSGRQYEGQQVGTALLVSDVTGLKRAERIRSEFTANVSHELKTPLTSIKGFTDLLAGGMVADPGDQGRFLTMIGVEVDRLIGLIDDILKLSELESASPGRQTGCAPLLETARAAAELLAPAAGQAGIRLCVEGEEVLAAVPPARLKELLLNLMENGIKYNEPGGRVEVRAGTRAGRAVAVVSDTGIGIPEEAQSRVFERFYRVDKGRSRKNGGTGLGLAIVKHIAQLYGGTVSLESTPGAGSVFTVTLPPAGGESEIDPC